MTPATVEESEAIHTLGQMAGHFGVRWVVTLLAEIAHERADHLMLAGDRPEAVRHMQEYRVLERAAETLPRRQDPLHGRR